MLFSQHNDGVSKPEENSCYRSTCTQWKFSFTNEAVIAHCFLKDKVMAMSASGLPDQTSQALQSQSANETLRLSGMWPEDTDYLRLHMVISEGI